jgi:hypothetical protein
LKNVSLCPNPQIRAELAAQVLEYQYDINPLKTYPIVSFGVDYNFSICRSQ